MKKSECNVCSELVKEKYKRYKLWKLLAIIFMCLTFLFAVLYFTSGAIIKDTTVEYTNKVTIENDGDNNSNSENGNIIVKNENNSTQAIFIIVCIIILLGGVPVVCYIISTQKNKNK